MIYNKSWYLFFYLLFSACKTYNLVGVYENPPTKSFQRYYDYYVKKVNYSYRNVLSLYEDSTYTLISPCSGIDSGKWSIYSNHLFLLRKDRLYFNDSIQNENLKGNLKKIQNEKIEFIIRGYTLISKEKIKEKNGLFFIELFIKK